MKKIYSYFLLVVALMLSKCFGGTGEIPYFVLDIQARQQMETQRIVEFWTNINFDFNDVYIVTNSFQTDARNYLQERIDNAKLLLLPREDAVNEVLYIFTLNKEYTMLNSLKMRECVGNDLNSCALARMLYYFPLMVEQNVLKKLQEQNFYGKRLERVLPEQREIFRLILKESIKFADTLLANIL